MTTAKTKKTKAQNIAKVRAALRRVCDKGHHDAMGLRQVVKAQMIGYDAVVLKLKNGKIVIFKGEMTDIEGVRWGGEYNIHVWTALEGLADLGMITDQERTDFGDRLRGADQEQEREADLKKLRDLAHRHGFDLVRK